MYTLRVSSAVTHRAVASSSTSCTQTFRRFCHGARYAILVPSGEIVAAVRSAAEGDSALSPVVADRLMTRVRTPRTSLTPRELEVLKLVAAGSSNREIGVELMLSEATVKSHLVHIYDKLGVRSRTSAVAAAREQGVL